jgi:hypothetical protein
MAARYATSTFSITLASGASHLVIIGAHRDSTHGAVTANPGAFGTTPLAVPQISPRLATTSRPTRTGRRYEQQPPEPAAYPLLFGLGIAAGPGARLPTHFRQLIVDVPQLVCDREHGVYLRCGEVMLAGSGAAVRPLQHVPGFPVVVGGRHGVSLSP